MDIEIKNLKKIYGVSTAVDIPELTIHSGEIVGLVGNNGAGKTTLMRLILDLIGANEGKVFSNGKAVDEDEQWKEYTGSFIDGTFLIDFYTAEEYFSFIAQAYGIDEDTLQQRLEVFRQLMHDEIISTGKQLCQLSEGNRQKVGIIGAMIINPKVLLLDEPFNYLDPSSQILVARLIKQLNINFGTTVLISSHNIEYITEIATRVLLLERGRIIKDLSNLNNSAKPELLSYFNA